MPEVEIGKLTVQLRDVRGKGSSRRLRVKGQVPGICYGANLDMPLAISVDPKQLKHALDPSKRRNTVIQVTVDGDGRQLTAMLKDFQIDSLHQEVIHVDLLSIDVNKDVEVEVPVHLTGKAVGTVDGGLIHVVRHSVLVACKPTEIPTKFELDITPLGIGDALHVSDLKLSGGVRLAMSAGTTLVTCVAPKAEKVEAVAEEAAVPVEGAPAEGAKPGEGAAAAPAAGDKAAGDKAGGKAPAAAEKDKGKEKGGGDKAKK